METSYPAMAFLGVGTMAEAVIARALLSGWPREKLILSHRRLDRRVELERRFGGTIEESVSAVVGRADYIFLSVRPQQVEGVLSEIFASMSAGQCLISLPAALKLSWIAERVPRGIDIVRVTPPPTTWVGAGCTLLAASPNTAAEKKQAVERLMGFTAERLLWIDDEHMEAAVAASLSVTPYVCHLIEILADAAGTQGLDRAFIRPLILQSVIATGKMLENGGMDPGEIIERVATKEGLTWAALHTMDAYGLPRAVTAGVRAMTARSLEIMGEPVPDELMGYLR